MTPGDSGAFGAFGAFGEPGALATSTGPAAGRAAPATVTISGFPLALDRRYDVGTHMWVQRTGPDRARIGLDPLGIDTSGTLAQLSFAAVGTRVARGRPFGQLEAAKFVGPLVSPVSGTVLAVNEAAAADPGLAERDPFGAGWLIEVRLSEPAGELSALLGDPDEITRWFAAEIDGYRREGVIAE